MKFIVFILFQIGAYAWTWHTTYTHRKQRDMIILSLIALLAVVNIYYVNEMIGRDLTVVEHLLQMGACSCLLPLLYTYFSRRVGQSNRLVRFVLWFLTLLTFIPGIYIFNPLEPFVEPASGIHPFAFYVLSHGQKLFAIYTGDLVVLLQSAVIATRLPIFMYMMRTHKLVLSRTTTAFVTFWMLMLAATIWISFMDYAFLRGAAGQTVYLALYMVLILSFNILIILQYHIHLVETEQGEAIENIDIYIQTQYSQMAEQLKKLMVEQQLYLDSQLSVESIIARLNTNRTYFAEMMLSEFGMSYNDYLSDLRLRHVEQLLSDESLSISTIAAQSGFTDARYMARKFKAVYGLTPTEWREENRHV